MNDSSQKPTAFQVVFLVLVAVLLLTCVTLLLAATVSTAGIAPLVRCLLSSLVAAIAPIYFFGFSLYEPVGKKPAKAAE